MTAVEVIAEALAKHQYRGRALCRCGWKSDTEDSFEWIPRHEAHQASVIAALPNIAIVSRPKTAAFDAATRDLIGKEAWIYGMAEGELRDIVTRAVLAAGGES